MDLKKVLVVSPTYNEKENITRLVREVLSIDQRLELLVVDDNSPDGTAALVESLAKTEPRLKLLTRTGKLGLGSAYLYSFAFALKYDYDAFIMIDADFSHDPKYLRDFLRLLPEWPMVIGSRYVKGGSIQGWPWYRLAMSFFGNLYARCLLRIPIRELTGGFNGFQTELLRQLPLSSIQSMSYAFQTELKLLAYERQAKWIEFPICFTDRILGQSKIPRNQIFITLNKVTRWGCKRWLGILPGMPKHALRGSTMPMGHEVHKPSAKS